MSPTNLSALLVNGITTNKFFHKYRNLKHLKCLNADYIFIDEISMVKEIFYKYFHIIKVIKPNIKFIISGDFRQLPPINDRAEFDYQNSQILKELCDFNKILLSKYRRSDDVLFNICNNLQSFNKKVFKSEFTKKHICFTNKKRIELNKLMMEQESKICKRQNIIVNKNKHDENSQNIIVYAGLPLISKKNDDKLDICNNEQFIIKQVSRVRNTFIIKNEIKELEFNIDQITRFFYPAYAITCHKSHGSTINTSYTIHEIEKFSVEMLYVALTRASDINLINII